MREAWTAGEVDGWNGGRVEGWCGRAPSHRPSPVARRPSPVDSPTAEPAGRRARAPRTCSVPGPPCATKSTIGTPLAMQYVHSRSARSPISPPHACGATLPVSTKT
eukprot:5291860-Prymnesium_polylepis.1